MYCWQKKFCSRDWDFSDFFPLIQIEIETESWIIFFQGWDWDSESEIWTNSFKAEVQFNIFSCHVLRLRPNDNFFPWFMQGWALTQYFFPVMYWGWDQMIIFFFIHARQRLRWGWRWRNVWGSIHSRAPKSPRDSWPHDSCEISCSCLDGTAYIL